MLVKETGSDFKPCPGGTHLARCFGVVALGTQPTNNPSFKETFKVMLLWELANELMENGETFVISKEYTASLGDKATLRHHLQSWRGKPFTADELKGFALDKLINAPCMITVTHEQTQKGKTYAKVASVTTLLKGSSVPELTKKPVHYLIEHGKNDVFLALPEWIQKKIEQCNEWSVPAAPPVEAAAPDDDAMSDVPFMLFPPWMPFAASAAAGLLA